MKPEKSPTKFGVQMLEIFVASSIVFPYRYTETHTPSSKFLEIANLHQIIIFVAKKKIIINSCDEILKIK